MDFFRNLLGNLTSTVLRLGLIAGTLALVYVFAIRPALDTTEEAFKTFAPLTELSQQQLQNTQQEIDEAFKESGAPQAAPSGFTITRTLRNLKPKEAQALARCMERAAGDLSRVNACFDRFAKKAKRDRRGSRAN